jgi:hypothetical protein
MRKIVLTVVATCAVVAFIPASALAHGHKRHHRAHHVRVHHRTFGHDWGQSSAPTSTSAQQNAGTVQSFDATTGVLTIALNNNQGTVSGMVTPDTEIECEAVDMSATSHWRSHDHGGDNGGNDQGDDQGGGDDENENENENAQNCDTSSLMTGTVVHAARLSLSGAGATWDKIELVTPSVSAVDNDNDGD